jgi:uncharacterized membrane protein YkoI
MARSEFSTKIKSQLKRSSMNTKTILCLAVAASALAGCASEEHKQKNKSELMAQARVSKDDAVKTALAKVPNGTIKEAELEKEHGRLIWSFDVATPESKDITEINVDAITGDLVSAEKETPDKN